MKKSSDSGSPVHGFLNGKAAVVGLNSFGLILINRTTTEEIRCVGLSNFCRLSYEKPFIEKMFEDNDYCLI